MYLAVMPRPNNRKYLAIVHGYRDENGKVKRKTIQSLGYLDELEKDYKDPVAHFKSVAAAMEVERKAENAAYNFSLSKTACLSIGENSLKNVGYAAYSKIYHELAIHEFLINRQRHSKESYDANTIMKMLVFLRLIAPASKKSSFDNRNILFEKHDYTLDDVYRCLSLLHRVKDDLQIWLNDKVKANYGRDTSLIYYDVTNYYFESDIQDDFKRKGVSKEHRPNPIVQMGLFIDNNALPITYELFPGNTNDCLTYRPNFGRIKKKFNLGRVISVADKGMTTGDNIWYTVNTPTNDGYVFSMSVRGADKELKSYVLDENGYRWHGKDYKRKSRLYPRTISVSSVTGKKIKKQVDEKQVVFWSEKYALRARAEREAALAKAMDLKRNPGSYTRATSYGAAKYIRKITFDKNTGEILQGSSVLEINEELVREEEALDGYYVLLTSEIYTKDDKIIDIYRGLWRIEESFRITKSELEARPVFVWTREHIEAHFLTCFVSLLLERILEMKLSHKYSSSRIINSLQKATCAHAVENYYFFHYYDEILQEIGGVLDIDFSTKVRSLGEIKKLLSLTKKGRNTQHHSDK